MAKDIKALRQEVKDDRDAREKNKASGKLVVEAEALAGSTDWVGFRALVGFETAFVDGPGRIWAGAAT